MREKEAKRFENKTPRLILDLIGIRMGSKGSFIVRNFIVCTVQLIHQAIKFGGLRWAGHVSRIEDSRNGF